MSPTFKLQTLPNLLCLPLGSLQHSFTASRSFSPVGLSGCTATKRNSCSRSVKAATDAGVAGTSNRTTQIAWPPAPPEQPSCASSQLRLLISPVAGRAIPRVQNIAAEGDTRLSF